MVGSISNLIVIVCLTASVVNSALVRNERQWNHLDYLDRDPYGQCGKPNIPIPHGGIKLFPTFDLFDPHDDSCQTTSRKDCEPKFYCFDGYDVDGNFDLKCVHDWATEEYKWEGDIPKCVKPTSSYPYIYPIIFVCVIGFVVLISVIIRRKIRSTPTRCVTRTVVITPSSTPSMTGRSPGYTRFDDSNVQVPRDTTTPNTQNK